MQPFLTYDESPVSESFDQYNRSNALVTPVLKIKDGDDYRIIDQKDFDTAIHELFVEPEPKPDAKQPAKPSKKANSKPAPEPESEGPTAAQILDNLL